MAARDCVIMHQVDVTWIRSIHRTSGTFLGCVFGYLVLLRPQTAGNPYALTALLCAWSFLCGLTNFTRFRYGAFLACYTGSIVTLVGGAPLCGPQLTARLCQGLPAT